MVSRLCLLFATHAAIAVAQTWTTQSAFLPGFEWVVLDHADGNSMGYGVTVAGGFVFTSGSMKQTVRVLNPQTGVEVETANQGEDGDIFLSKVSVDGTPTSIWTYAGTMNEFPSHLATSVDDEFISMTGYFSGNLTFGTVTFTNTKPDARDGFVVKIAVADGTVMWAHHFEATSGTRAYGTAFDTAGNVAVSMQSCELLENDGGQQCVGVIALLAAEDGSLIWERRFGEQVPSLRDVVLSSDGQQLYVVGSLTGTTDFGGTVGVLSSGNAGYSDALLLALSVDSGEVTWAALSTAAPGDSDPTSSTSLVEAENGYVWIACSGPCAITTSTASSTSVTHTDGMLGGAVLKFNETTGEPIWAADIPSALGMAVADGAVYVNTHRSSPLTVGDTTFETMGSLDHYIMKIDADGHGQWVISTGGSGMEYVRRMATDPNGDLYTIGLTQSNPSYFDPIVLTAHDSGDGYDIFIGKLQTSQAALPSCKTTETTVASEACFVANVCYSSGESSRVAKDKCKYCSPSVSQTSLDGFDASNYCLIDGVCYGDGEFRQLPGGFSGTVDSDCEYCNVGVSTTQWTLVDGFTTGEDGTCADKAPEDKCTHCGAGYNCYGNHDLTCHADVNTNCVNWYASYGCPAGATCIATYSSVGQACVESGEFPNCCGDDRVPPAIAGYEPSTDVTAQAMIDLDAKEIEEYSDQAGWNSALFVYANGGNGLCTALDIAIAAATDPCFNKTTSDAKGNSITGTGEVRTIMDLATSGRTKMADEAMWNLYRDYYSDDKYADTFIRNALSSDGAWRLRSSELRAELSAKGAKYQAVWMYVIHRMEDAIAGCKAGNSGDSSTVSDSSLAWDEAWAFYAGSLEDADGTGKGYLLYDLAEKRCPQFGTCGASGNAIANEIALASAEAGLEKIRASNCTGVTHERDTMVVQMTIPLIQGMIRYLYLADPIVNGGSCTAGVCTYDKAWAEGWAFAAAVLPQINQCDAAIATLLAANLNVSAAQPIRDGYRYVKEQVEKTYSCMGITCADIGAYQDESGVVFEGMEACQEAAPSEFLAIAGYLPSTNVSQHAKIDLDVKEVEEYSDAADWSTALFVYENGGNGICTSDDIASASATDSCFGKTTLDARGNSIKGSGQVRTLRSFATAGRSEMANEPMWNLYRDYYSDDNYADTFIRNALSPAGAWNARSDALRAELSAKGVKYQAVWMYVIHEMEDAVKDCRNGNIYENEASTPEGDSPHSWDEAWAFYAGSLEDVDGSGNGYLLYDLAEKRCPQFGTCGSSGGAIANEKALAIADMGHNKILAGDCDGVAVELDSMIIQMTIPLIQGLIRYLYLADPMVNGGSCSNGVCTYDKAWAEGWAFAAAVLPQIDRCDASVARLLVKNLDIDAAETPMSDGYQFVKEQVEATYAYLNINCMDVGAYQDENGVVFEGMEACDGSQFPAVAAYSPSTDVSAQALIDLDAKEIEEFSDATDWTSALFVYENGGGGLCTSEVIASASATEPCYGKTVADAKGNSIMKSGEILTIEGFATSGRSMMASEPMWNLYRDYFNDDNYADTFIRNAISPNGAWSSRSDALRAELSAKGAKYQAVWMYVIHQMEDAVAECRAGNEGGDSMLAWDEAWAFYAGSSEGVDGSGKGYLLYDLAEKRCPQFGTCGMSGNAMANENALAIAKSGLEKIRAADCDGVAVELNDMIVQMSIPLIQGMIRYLFLADPTVNDGSCSNGVCTYDKEWAEGWAFAAAVLPQISKCDASVAEMLVSNLDVSTAETPMKNGYRLVKARVETTYACLGITCADIGAYQDSDGTVFEGMDACSDEKDDAIAGYSPMTSVSSHAMIDLDVKEIEESSDAADWTTALFVYENGGNGLCTSDDIEAASATDPCFGKTTSDAKGNSFTDSGDIRTMRSLATSGRSLMEDDSMWNLYRNYYDDDNYADTFIRNAISPNGLWSSRSDALRAELSAKGVKYQAVWMHVVQRMEDAVADCREGGLPNAWDEAWAFYSGSLEGVDGAGKGYLLYDLADKRCPQFDTCDSSNDALANVNALATANAGLADFLVHDCDGVAAKRDEMIVQMTIPLIQGLIRYMYLADPAVNGGSCVDGTCTYDKEWAEGWAFAAAVLPQIHRCDASVAELLASNIDVDNVVAPMTDGHCYVKSQVETIYECLNITHADVGEYLAYRGDADVCLEDEGSDDDKKSNKRSAAAMIIVVIVAIVLVVAICSIAVFFVLRCKRNRAVAVPDKHEMTVIDESDANAML